jgi:hypothetical protein
VVAELDRNMRAKETNGVLEVMRAQANSFRYVHHYREYLPFVDGMDPRL